MSRFSKSDAEKLGWVFYHDSEENVLRDGDNELGVSRVVPASLRAEKYIDLPGVEATRTTEEAPTIGLLLERIHLVESEWAARLPPSEPDAREADVEPNPDKQVAKQNAENARVSGESLAGEDLEDLTVKQLKEKAAELGVEAKGRKGKLIDAIRAVL